MTIQGRLTLAVSVLLSATLAGTFGILGVTELLHLRGEQEREQTAALEKLARVGEEAVLNRNDVILLNYLQGLKSAPGLAYALFSGADGAVLAHTDVTKLGARLDDDASRRAASADGRLRQEWVDSAGRTRVELAMPVGSGGRRLGTARMGFDKAALERRLRDGFGESVRRFCLVVVAALAAGFAGAWVLARGFNRPLTELAHGARMIGSGKLEHRLPEGREDELGQLSAEFNRMAERLKELDELKDGFIHSVSHEMRSPLTAIQAYASVLSEDQASAPSPKLKKGLGIIRTEVERLTSFVNDILDLAKLRAKRMEFERAPVDLGQLARDVTELFEPKARELGVALSAPKPPEGVGRANGDREALRRALINLVSNALKFTPEKGSVTLTVTAHGGVSRVAVSDTGVGVPKDKLPLLFTRFMQVEETKNAVRKTGGTGLGLSLVKEIVEAHGGTVGAESEPGKGATFFFELPAS